MKKGIYFFIMLFMIIAFTGCNYLNYNEEDFISNSEKIFTDFDKTKRWLTGIYAELPDGFNGIGGAMRASATDDAVEAAPGSIIHDFYNGSWSPLNAVDNRWAHLYGGIREANMFLANIDSSVLDPIKYNKEYQQDSVQFQYFRAEARFLRAYFYFELYRRYGSIPLVTRVLNQKEANNVEPASADSIVHFIANECESIVNILPVKFDNVLGGETGRANKGAVMALKAKTLLYAASPLFNPSNNKSKWIAAARAANAIISAGWYSLDNNYSDVFNNLNSTGLILGRRFAPDNSFEKSNFPISYGGMPGTCPSQNLVDAYEMKITGLPVSDPISGYDPTTPYMGRDPRFYQTIIFNNSLWKGKQVEIWNGGKDGPPLLRSTVTGYYLKKYVDENLNIIPPNVTTSAHVWIYFRYGGILLDYAEAMNEAYGPDNPGDLGMTARQAVNKVRQRAGMPDFPTGMAKEVFRKKLHNERRVEMAFEGQRFWDLRRWKSGPKTVRIYGTKVTKKSLGTFEYEKKVVEKRQWSNKYYRYPIPLNELYINESFQQNPGW